MREIKFRAWDEANKEQINIDKIVMGDDGSIAYIVPVESDIPPYQEDEIDFKVIGSKFENPELLEVAE